MIEQRRLRFANITGLERDDLRLAGEIWLDELFRAPWVSCNAMKLGTVFVRYMADADPAMLTLEHVAGQYELTLEEIMGALSLMRMFGAIDSFRIEAGQLRASLNLSLLQRLRTLEAKQRFCELMAFSRSVGNPGQGTGARWAPVRTSEPVLTHPVARIASARSGD